MGHPEDGRRVRQAPKYHGLFNQGSTCYLNSVLQVLFMTKDFREAVESSTDENSDTIDRHLNSLFSDLKKYSAYTDNITKALDIDTGFEQRDAAEYIEKILQLTSDGASKIFQGEWSHRTICCTCGTETVRDEAFWHLPLALDSCSDGYSVEDGINDFFKDSVFSGEDQMYCNTCNVKVDAEAQYVMKHHPDVLILLLKRFEFDYQYMSYVKISCAVDVPFTILIPEGQTYKLYAVVDHSGDLRGGHYTATINDEDRWYKFNDSSVSLCDYQPFQVDNMERSGTAQLLFYTKTEETVNQDNMSNNQCEDAEKTRWRDEGEDDVETGHDTAVTPSVGENEVTGNEGVVRNVSGIVGLPEEPGHEGNVRQTVTHSNQEDNEERKDESDTDRERTLDANFKPEVSDQPKICDLPNQQEETNDAQSRVTDKDEMTGGKVSENPPKDYFNGDTEHLSEGGLDKQNRNEDQDSKLKTGQQFDPEHVDKQEVKIKANIEGNTEKETGANAYPTVSVKHFTKHDSVCEQGRSSRLDKTPEQQEKEEREAEANNEQKRKDLDKKHDRNEISDNGRPCDARPYISKKNPVEFLDVVVKGNEETVIYQFKKDNKGSCKDGRVGSFTRSKPSDNQKSKRDNSHPLGRHVEDEKGQKNDSQRDGGHEQRRGSGRKDSKGGKGKDSGIRQRNVKKQAEEKEEKGDLEQFHNREDLGKEGTVRGERQNQDVESVQLSDKATGPAKTNRDKRIISRIRRFFKRDKKRTGAAEDTSNSSYNDQHPNRFVECASSSMQTERPVLESKKRKIWRTKKQHGERKEKEKEELKGKKKKRTKLKAPGCFSFPFKRSEKNRVEKRTKRT